MRVFIVSDIEGVAGSPGGPGRAAGSRSTRRDARSTEEIDPAVRGPRTAGASADRSHRDPMGPVGLVRRFRCSRTARCGLQIRRPAQIDRVRRFSRAGLDAALLVGCDPGQPGHPTVSSATPSPARSRTEACGSDGVSVRRAASTRRSAAAGIARSCSSPVTTRSAEPCAPRRQSDHGRGENRSRAAKMPATSHRRAPGR